MFVGRYIAQFDLFSSVCTVENMTQLVYLADSVGQTANDLVLPLSTHS